MKNGKAPSRKEKDILRAHGLAPGAWLVIKSLPDSIEVVSRIALKKVRNGTKPRTRILSREL